MKPILIVASAAFFVSGCSVADQVVDKTADAIITVCSWSPEARDKARDEINARIREQGYKHQLVTPCRD